MKHKKKKIHKWTKLSLFVFCWLFIAFVSSLDTMLTIQTKEYLFINEQNPIAVMILEEDNWNVSRFIAMKMFGTVITSGILILIYQFSNRHGLTVVLILAILELLLLYYLLVF